MVILLIFIIDTDIAESLIFLPGIFCPLLFLIIFTNIPTANEGKKNEALSMLAVQTLDNIFDKTIIKNCPLELLTEGTKADGGGEDWRRKRWKSLRNGETKRKEGKVKGEKCEVKEEEKKRGTKQGNSKERVVRIRCIVGTKKEGRTEEKDKVLCEKNREKRLRYERGERFVVVKIPVAND